MDLISEARLRAVSSLGENLFRYVAMRGTHSLGSIYDPMIPHAHRRVYDLCARHMNEVASENISEVSTRLLYAVGGEINAVLLVLTCL